MSANLMSLARSGGKFLKLFGDRKMMKQLPYDSEVEYLESTGSKTFISFGLSSNYDSGVIVMSYDYDFGNRLIVMGSSANTFAYFELNEKGFWKLADNKSTIACVRGKKTRIQIYADKTVSVDGENIGSRSVILGAQSPYEFCIFMTGNHNLGFNANGARCHSVMLEKSGVVVIDAIPVRVGSAGYMFDRVSGILFGNASIGAFLLGPDKTT